MIFVNYNASLITIFTFKVLDLWIINLLINSGINLLMNSSKERKIYSYNKAIAFIIYGEKADLIQISTIKSILCFLTLFC